MDLDGEEQVQALQRKMDKEELEENSGLSDSDEEIIRVLDIEKLKVKHASLSEKQNKLVAKIDAMRRKIHKMTSSDKND